MGPFQRYSVAIRLRHPTLDPNEISKTLAMNAEVCWSATDPRTTPRGRALEGTHAESYWTSGNLDGSQPPSLAHVLETVLGRLTTHRDILRRIRAEGGRTELFVDDNEGGMLPFDLLARLGELSVDVSLNVYGGSPQGASHQNVPDGGVA